MQNLNLSEELRTKLEEFNKITESEINTILSGTKVKGNQDNKELKDLKQYLNKILEDISKNGESPHHDWKLIRNLIVIKVKDALLQMQSTFPDCKPSSGESFEEQMEVILQFLCGFEEK